MSEEQKYWMFKKLYKRAGEISKDSSLQVNLRMIEDLLQRKYPKSAVLSLDEVARYDYFPGPPVNTVLVRSTAQACEEALNNTGRSDAEYNEILRGLVEVRRATLDLYAEANHPADLERLVHSVQSNAVNGSENLAIYKKSSFFSKLLGNKYYFGVVNYKGNIDAILNLRKNVMPFGKGLPVFCTSTEFWLDDRKCPTKIISDAENDLNHNRDSVTDEQRLSLREYFIALATIALLGGTIERFGFETGLYRFVSQYASHCKEVAKIWLGQ